MNFVLWHITDVDQLFNRILCDVSNFPIFRIIDQLIICLITKRLYYFLCFTVGQLNVFINIKVYIVFFFVLSFDQQICIIAGTLHQFLKLLYILKMCIQFFLSTDTLIIYFINSCNLGINLILLIFENLSLQVSTSRIDISLQIC